MSNPRPKLNRELLRKTATRLRNLRVEEKYDQGSFYSQTSCGTACCIAGHALLASGRRLKPRTDTEALAESIRQRAMLALGLTYTQSSNLFGPLGERWPQPFAQRFDAAIYNGSGERPSRIAADLLDALASGKVRLSE